MPAITKMLAEMDREIVDGGKLVCKQLTAINKLGWKNHDTTEAQQLLWTLLESQEVRMGQRDRMRSYLGQ